MQVLSENFVNQSSYHLLLSLILNGIHNRNVPVEQICVTLNTQIKKLLP